ncbi:MAG: hypothetical protein GXX96_23290 [Planctomycetaceae bacterium]|jgi:hypothetical protein|nr:hypothetical protein [Planctomycetaceae bacterium]
MSSAILSAECVPAIGRLEGRSSARRISGRTIAWRAVGENASGALFLAALVWELWRFGNLLFHSAALAAAAMLGGLC